MTKKLISFIIIKFNTKLYGISSTPLLILIVTGLVALLLYGKVTNQAKSWFQLGPITIQPSEFAKVVIVLFIAWLITKIQKNGRIEK